ncbi:MAG: cobyric acid synthase [Candidatus Mycalebacterium zealandia]|nr:MAG: cobyric acid synthase [Candidatus Mycalebacterium zealandia]
MKAKTLMIQGTASHAGKSVIAAGLCRIFARKGFSVAPFKSQNMSLNSFVTPDGSEIGRAQAMQAHAAGVAPSADMNPILLKPLKDDGSQVMVLGKSAGNMTFAEYVEFRPRALEAVSGGLERVMSEFEVVVIEGAGGAAEINFSRSEIVNMTVAKLADSPVLLVSDIDRGGAFASLAGTLDLLGNDRDRVRGMIINKFRGNRVLLDEGIEFIERKAGKPVLGVVPHIKPLFLDDEDSVYLENPVRRGGGLKVCVPKLPRISNFTDVRPLEMERGVSVSYALGANDLCGADAVVLPGSKATIEDLRFLKRSGIADALAGMSESGVPVIGICGGYQMLGSALEDADGFESAKTSERGLGFFPAETEIHEEKTLRQTSATVENGGAIFSGIEGEEITGYEIHMGQTQFSGANNARFLKKADGSFDGAVSENGNVYGTYLHGIFENDNLRSTFLNHLRAKKGLPDEKTANFATEMEKQYERLADVLEESLDMNAVMSMVFG